MKRWLVLLLIPLSAGILTLILVLGVSGFFKIGKPRYESILEAVKAGDKQSVRYLLEQGKNNTRERTPEGYDAFLLAVAEGNADLAALLLSSGYSVYQRDAYGNNAMHLAVRAKNLYMVDFLKQRGVGINLTNHEQKTPLHIAVEMRAPEVAQKLVRLGADPTAIYGGTAMNLPILLAAHYQYWDVVEALRAVGVRYSLADAIAAGDLYTVKAALEKSPDALQALNGAAGPREDLMEVAVGAGQLEIIRLLHEKGMPIACHLAASGDPFIPGLAVKGAFDVIEYLVKNGCDINCATPRTRGNGLFHMLVRMNGPAEPVARLVKLGADINLQNDLGQTPLHLAAEMPNPTLLKAFLKQKAKVDLADKDGRTPLHYAAQRGRLQNVKALVEAGASLTIRDKKNVTPYEAAKAGGYTLVAEYLEKKMKASAEQASK